MGCELPDFDRHVCGFAPGAGSCGNLPPYGISALGVGNVDDPVAQEKFLRLGENAVGDGYAVFLATYDLGFTRLGQALCGDKLSGCGEVLVDAPKSRHVRLDILFRPGVIALNACPRARHQQNIFHILRSFNRSFEWD